MKGYYSKIRELEKELERSQKIYSKLCRQRENLNDRKGVVMFTECMDLAIQLISVSITISSISEQLRYLHEEYKKYKEENSREFYAPMDNVDIVMLIHKDGSIHGTILCLVDRRGIAQKILLSNAAKMIMVHNHPSGDPTPSKEDLNVSNELKKLGELLGIPFVDSIILGDWVYKSFAEEGIL